MSLITYLREYGYVEHRVISVFLHGAVSQHRAVLEGHRFLGSSGPTPLIRALLRVVHLVEPVGRRGEPAPVEDHAHGEVSVVQVQVERHRPHHDQPRVQVLDLPADGAARTRGRSALQRG